MILLLITFSSSLSVFKYNKLFLILTLYLMLLLNSPFVKVLPFCRFYWIFNTHNCNVCKYMFASSFSIVVSLIFLALLHRLAHPIQCWMQVVKADILVFFLILVRSTFHHKYDVTYGFPTDALNQTEDVIFY